MASEVMSFGSSSRLVQAMHPADKKAIAGTFGVAAPVLANWLHAISAIRNIAAQIGCISHCLPSGRYLAHVLET
jgi:abortive infection bacteriophage resistance protein